MECKIRLSEFLLAVVFSAAGAVQADDRSQPRHIADADDRTMVHAGMSHYKTYCAQCHGRQLQGQPLWQLQDADQNRRAPAQDDTGHTWQHSDEELFQKIRSGKFSEAPSLKSAYMPGFARLLSDVEILEVMAFIKARWSLGIRVAQASLNPDFAGMPVGGEGVSWTLPPNCGNATQGR